MLAALADGKLKTWFYPNAIYVDKDLMDKTMAVKEGEIYFVVASWPGIRDALLLP